MYDLELTSQLAKYTQKDPKEYLPYLKYLSELDPILKKYQINYDLKNYSKALFELVQGGDQYRSLCMSLIKDHGLYIQGLELLKGNDLLTSIAESLLALSHPLEAASLYESCQNYEKAKELYLNCEEWDLACKMAEFLNENLKETICARCADLGRFEAAASMITNEDNENLAIKYWVLAGKYKQAAVAAKTNEGKQLLKSTLIKYSLDMIEDIHKNLRVYKEKKARLGLIQQNKKLMPDSQKFLNDETASLYSLDSSMSKMTQFTKKQKKKAKKIRKTAAKEGSQYEEDYLVDLLITLRPDNLYLEKIDNLCAGLILCGEFVPAYNLWSQVEELKNLTFPAIFTLKQQEFLKKFFETFPEIAKNDENESKLGDIYSTSTFLAEGLCSHKLPTFKSKFSSFFKTLSKSLFV